MKTKTSLLLIMLVFFCFTAESKKPWNEGHKFRPRHKKMHTGSWNTGHEMTNPVIYTKSWNTGHKMTKPVSYSENWNIGKNRPADRVVTVIFTRDGKTYERRYRFLPKLFGEKGNRGVIISDRRCFLTVGQASKIN